MALALKTAHMLCCCDFLHIPGITNLGNHRKSSWQVSGSVIRRRERDGGGGEGGRRGREEQERCGERGWGRNKNMRERGEV